MIRRVLVAVILVAPAFAIAAPPSGNGFGKPGPGDNTMARSTFLALGTSVTLTLAAGDGLEYVRTGDNSTVRGFGLIASFPLMLWGIDRVNADHGDAASWAITVASTGLVAYGLWPMIDRFVLGHKDDSDSDSDRDLPAPLIRHHVHAGPTAIAGPHGTGAGLGVVATF